MIKEISKEKWLLICDEIDDLFPKGINKERGKAIVLIAKIFSILDIRVKE